MRWSMDAEGPRGGGAGAAAPGAARVLAEAAVFREGPTVDFVAPRGLRKVGAPPAAFWPGRTREGGRGVRNFCADSARFAQRLRTK